MELIGDVLALAEDSPVTWAVDLNADGGALLIALLTGHGQRLLYIPGRTVHHSSRGYRGDGKTDAKDAYVIADQARMRRDLQPLQEWDETAVDLKILTARRYGLAADRNRAINRMRAQLLEYFPALERAFDYAAFKVALVLLTGYRTPSGLRRVGPSRLATWLKNRKVRGVQAMADAAVAAAQAQHTAVTGESTAAAVVNALARAVLALDDESADIDAQIAVRLREHRHAEVVRSMLGMGPLLGAECIACTCGDMDAFGSAGRLAGVAGLAPVPRDSGRISGNTDGETTARCPADLVLKDGAEAVCVSTFEGLEVEWDVIVGPASDAHGRSVQWSAEPRKGILTRDGAANQVYNNYSGPDLVRCSNIPKAVLVPMLGISGHSCQTVVDGKAGKPMPIEVGLVYPKLQCRHRTLEACVG